MALEFSSPLDCHGHTDNHDDRLPYLPRLSRDAYCAHNISNSCSVIHPIPPLTATTLNPCIVPLHGNAADGADASIGEAQEVSYDIFQHISTRSAHPGIRVRRHRPHRAGPRGGGRARRESTGEMVAAYIVSG